MKLFIYFLALAMTTGLMQTKVSMTVIITGKNHFYYYENELAMDGANLKMGYPKDIKIWSELLEKERGKENVDYILKIESADSLNESSKNLATFFSGKPNIRKSKISVIEKALIDATEKVHKNLHGKQ
jgi:hypothetical protein